MPLEDLFAPSDGVSIQTKGALNQPDLYPTIPPAAAPAAPASGQSGLSTRPLTAQEALIRGDPKLLEALRRRGYGVKPKIQPAPDIAVPAPGYGVIR